MGVKSRKFMKYVDTRVVHTTPTKRFHVAGLLALWSAETRHDDQET